MSKSNCFIPGRIRSVQRAGGGDILGKGCKPVPRENFRDVFEDVKRKKIVARYYSIENSLFGSVAQNYDLLQEYPLLLSAK